MVLTISRPSVTIRSVSKPVTITTRRGSGLSSYKPSSSQSSRSTNRRYQNQSEIEKRALAAKKKGQRIALGKKLAKVAAKPISKVTRIAAQAGKGAGAAYSNIGKNLATKRAITVSKLRPIIRKGPAQKVYKSKVIGKPHGKYVSNQSRMGGGMSSRRSNRSPGSVSTYTGMKSKGRVIDSGSRGRGHQIPPGTKIQYTTLADKTSRKGMTTSAQRVALGKKLAQANIIQRKNQANVGKALVKAGRVVTKKKELGRKKKGKGKKIGKGTKLYNV